jgi:hypothetical protein
MNISERDANSLGDSSIQYTKSDGEIALDSGNGNISTNSQGESKISGKNDNLSSVSGSSSGLNLNGKGNGNSSTQDNSSVLSNNQDKETNSNSISQGSVISPGMKSNSISGSQSNISTDGIPIDNLNNGNKNENLGPFVNSGTLTGTSYDNKVGANNYANANININLNNNQNLNSNLNSNINENSNRNGNSNSNLSMNKNLIEVPKNFMVDIRGNTGKDFVTFKSARGLFISCNCDGIASLASKKSLTTLYLIKKLKNNQLAIRSYYGGYISIDSNGNVDCYSRIINNYNKLQIQLEANGLSIRRQNYYLLANKNLYSTSTRDDVRYLVFVSSNK